MLPLGRHQSSSSVISTVSSISATSSGTAHENDSELLCQSPTTTDTPLLPPPVDVTTRKRPNPSQLNALQSAFDVKPYLSRDERLALAASTGMELKAVTAWFQNRRQATRRAKASKAARDAVDAADRRRALGRAVSLDDFASRTERRRTSSSVSTPVSASSSFVFSENPSPNTPPLPSTPRRRVVRATSSTPSKHGNDIWQLVPSSPVAPPSSPGTEKERFLALPEQAHSRRSLEYACANARAGPVRAARPRDVAIAEEGYPTSAKRYQSSAGDVGPDWVDTRRNKENLEGTIRRLNLDVEAAMMLLGFQKQSP